MNSSKHPNTGCDPANEVATLLLALSNQGRGQQATPPNVRANASRATTIRSGALRAQRGSQSNNNRAAASSTEGDRSRSRGIESLRQNVGASVHGQNQPVMSDMVTSSAQLVSSAGMVISEGAPDDCAMGVLPSEHGGSTEVSQMSIVDKSNANCSHGPAFQTSKKVKSRWSSDFSARADCDTRPASGADQSGEKACQKKPRNNPKSPDEIQSKPTTSDNGTISENATKEKDDINLKPAPYFHYVERNKEGESPHGPIVHPQTAPSFVVKLHAVLVRKDMEDVVSWLPHGRSWKIISIRKFEERVIRQYFNRPNISSFYRQLYSWGFRRMYKGPDRDSFYHEYFLRSLPQLTLKMSKIGGGNSSDAADVNYEPNLSKIYVDRPLPDGVSPDDKYYILLTAVSECVERGGSKAKLTDSDFVSAQKRVKNRSQAKSPATPPSSVVSVASEPQSPKQERAPLVAAQGLELPHVSPENGNNGGTENEIARNEVASVQCSTPQVPQMGSNIEQSPASLQSLSRDQIQELLLLHQIQQQNREQQQRQYLQEQQQQQEQQRRQQQEQHRRQQQEQQEQQRRQQQEQQRRQQMQQEQQHRMLEEEVMNLLASANHGSRVTSPQGGQPQLPSDIGSLLSLLHNQHNDHSTVARQPSRSNESTPEDILNEVIAMTRQISQPSDTQEPLAQLLAQFPSLQQSLNQDSNHDGHRGISSLFQQPNQNQQLQQLLLSQPGLSLAQNRNFNQSSAIPNQVMYPNQITSNLALDSEGQSILALIGQELLRGQQNSNNQF